MTGTIASSLYEYLEMHNLFPVRQKGFRRNSRGTKDQFLIDKMVLNNCNKRYTDLGMTWINYRKAYNTIPHSCVFESFKLVQVSDKEIDKEIMKNWNT